MNETQITIGSSLGLSVLGLIIVFLVLVLLMIIIYVMTAIMKPKKKAETIAAQEATSVASAPKVAAKGSCGEVKLFDVPDREAAMVMAIVADQLETPINELRFISIKEVK